MSNDQRRITMTAGDGDPRHGTLNGYVNQRCRCVECRAAWAEYRRQQRAENLHARRSA
jgi:hypothetical protein